MNGSYEDDVTGSMRYAPPLLIITDLIGSFFQVKIYWRWTKRRREKKGWKRKRGRRRKSWRRVDEVMKKDIEKEVEVEGVWSLWRGAVHLGIRAVDPAT